MESDFEIKKLSDELKKEINKLSQALSSLEENVLVLQKGDDDNGSYWKGKKAYAAIEKCLNQIENNYNLVENLDKCSVYLDSLNLKTVD